MNIKNIVLVLAVIFACFVIGCEPANNKISDKPAVTAGQLPTMLAQYTETPIVLDGKLDEPVWQKAAVYKMALPADRETKGTLKEAAEVQLAWDDENFYVGVKFTDSDLIAQGDKDQLHHYKLGDLCELFLKPADKPWYWELYVTPAGKKTTFYFPSKAHLGQPSCFTDYVANLDVAACVQGTLNDGKGGDSYWTAEMVVPIKDLTARGETFGPDSDWRILVARYNYSVDLKTAPELSSAPKLSATNYHLTDEYAKLKLVK